MAELVKRFSPKKRVADIKDFYDKMTKSLIKSKNLSPAEAAKLSTQAVTDIADATSDAVSADRKKREFTKVMGDEFKKDMELALVDQEASRSDSKAVLDNFTEFGVSPRDSDAFLANAASEAQLLGIDGDANRFRGIVERSAGILNRTVGMFPKEEKIASLVIKTLSDKESDLVTIDKFFLTQVSEPSTEKYQIYQTFDQDFIFFFDRNPHIYVYSGVLINAEDNFQWRNLFQKQYEDNLRGTKCIENNARAVLTFEDVIRQGYLLEMNMQNTSNNPMHTPFSFTFFVTKEEHVHNPVSDGDKYDELVFAK